MTQEEEQERLIAVMRGNYLAKYFPDIWVKQFRLQQQRAKKNDNKPL